MKRQTSSTTAKIAVAALALGAAVSGIQGIAASVESDSSNAFPSTLNPLQLDLIQWMKENGSELSQKIEVRNEIPEDPTTVGVFATEDMDEDELVFSVPWKLLFKPEKVDFNECETVEAIYREITSPEGKITPYSKYLKEQPKKILPELWSEPGRKLLDELLGNAMHMTQFGKYESTDQWFEFCEEASKDEMNMHAWMLLMSKSDDHLLSPFYDFLNHRNGEHYNTLQEVVEDESFTVSTSKSVKAGQQLYTSFNQCDDCDGRIDWYGTIQVFRDHGFVESYPQRYFFDAPQVRLKFDLDYDEEAETYVVDFLAPLCHEAVDFMRTELKWLLSFAEKYGMYDRSTSANLDASSTANCPEDIPVHEWTKTWELYGALVKAFSSALKVSQDVEITDEVWKMGRDWYHVYDDDEDEDDEDSEYEYEYEDEDDDEDEDEDEYDIEYDYEDGEEDDQGEEEETEEAEEEAEGETESTLDVAVE